MKQNKKFVKVCPRCKSANVGIPKLGIDLLSYDNRCRECGYIGSFPEVAIDKVKAYARK